ncbi:hypothetical protein [Streptomyces sp. Rer75]|uniref:hypothetical protein n=1 Tax=unclassified Streptomyces TaxID=2593676 RepID=UPI00211EB934|nr:hypothetical protein [Streptomyces sp. Rer75]
MGAGRRVAADAEGEADVAADADADVDVGVDADVAGELNVRGLHALATAAVAAASRVRREVGLCTRTPSIGLGRGWLAFI